MLAQVVAAGQLQHLLPIEGRVETPVKALQGLGGVERRAEEPQGQLLLCAPLYLVFEEALQELDIRPLPVECLAVTGFEGGQDAGEAQLFELGGQLGLQFQVAPPPALAPPLSPPGPATPTPNKMPQEFAALRTKVRAGAASSRRRGRGGSASSRCSRIRLRVA